jgi:nucleoside-diphosphate-sugar epimerase
VRIAITGGAGFLGRHLAATLAGDAHDVRVIAQRPREAPLPWGLGGVPMTFVAADVTAPDAVASAVAGVDAVVHLAGMALPGRCRQFPLEALRVNGLGTATVIEACRTAGVPRVVVASSRRVAEAVLPSPDAYVMSKWVAEGWTLSRGQVVARLDNTYGPGQPEGTVVPDFIARGLAGAAPYASPRGETAPLLFVADAVRALALLAVAPRVTGLYAVRALAVVPLETLGAAIRALAAGSKRPENAAGEPREPDPRLAELGWTPRVPWPEGLARTWEASLERHAAGTR